jgi:hypothetical protein
VLRREAYGGIASFDVEPLGGQHVCAVTSAECLLYVRRPLPAEVRLPAVVLCRMADSLSLLHFQTTAMCAPSPAPCAC